jgi:hypothetical protein
VKKKFVSVIALFAVLMLTIALGGCFDITTNSGEDSQNEEQPTNTQNNAKDEGENKGRFITFETEVFSFKYSEALTKLQESDINERPTEFLWLSNREADESNHVTSGLDYLIKITYQSLNNSNAFNDLHDSYVTNEYSKSTQKDVVNGFDAIVSEGDGMNFVSYKTVIVFDKNHSNAVYFVFFNNTRDKNLEKDFTDIVNSFHFK